MKDAVDDPSNPWLRRRERLWRRLPYMSLQNQLLVLQYAGIAGIGYQMRCLPPGVFESQARTHDELILSWAERQIGVLRKDLPHLTWQLALSTSMGGFGLGSAVTISPIAYIAAVANSLRWAPILQRFTEATNPLPCDAQLTRNINDAIQRVSNFVHVTEQSIHPAIPGRERSPSSMSTVLPSSATNLYEFYKTQEFPNLQSSLTQRTNKQIYNALVGRAGADGNTEDVARWNSLQAPHAGRWLSVKPTERDLLLDDHCWRWAARLRLGIPVYQVADAPRCDCCDKTGVFASDTWHHLSCHKNKGGEITQRHHSVVNSIARHVRLACCEVGTEVRGLHPTPGAKETIPDAVVPGFRGSRQSLLLDVVVTHPTCPSHRDAASSKTLAASDGAVKRKVRRYTPLLAARADAYGVDDKFRAFAVETYGGLHQTAVDVIQDITKIAAQRIALFPTNLLKKSLMDSIAINIQRGNAAIMIDALGVHCGERKDAPKAG